MISFQKKNFGFVRRYPIVGGRRLSNYWWSVVIFLGGCGFLLTGISSYFNRNLLLVTPKFENAMHTRSYENLLEVKYARLPTCASIPYIPSVCCACSEYPVPPKEVMGVMGQHAEHAQHGNGSASLCTWVLPAGVEAQHGSKPKGKDWGLNVQRVYCFPKSQTTFSTLAQPLKEKTEELDIVNGVPNLTFFPQGLVLSFYGFLGLCFSFHLWLTLIWKIGVGFNEFNGKDKSVRIFRWGRPGKNRRIDIKYTKEVIETLKIKLVPKPALLLNVKGKKDIPLTNAALIGEFITLEDLETQATELTTLLKIPLEIAD